jgi:hypothetical protein
MGRIRLDRFGVLSLLDHIKNEHGLHLYDWTGKARRIWRDNPLVALRFALALRVRPGQPVA